VLQRGRGCRHCMFSRGPFWLTVLRLKILWSALRPKKLSRRTVYDGLGTTLQKPLVFEKLSRRQPPAAVELFQ
jgi:hypothetical protein